MVIGGITLAPPIKKLVQHSMPESQNHPPDLDRQRLAQLKKLGFSPRRFFDVGASNGCWSARISREFPDATFDLFEPLVDHGVGYRERMEIILSKHPLFRLHRVALGSECRKTRMYLPPDPVGSTALDLGACAPAEWQCIEVDMLTVDYMVQEFHSSPPEVIKIDTQGCELSVLQGARQTLPHVQVLVLECWLTRGYGQQTPLLTEIAAWLREFDFFLWDLGDSWRDEDGTLCSQDCLFLNARCPVSRLANEPRCFPPPAPPSDANGQEAWRQRVRHLLRRPA